jgi:hypothetical protein
MLISVIALLAFMFFGFFHVWPQAALAISFLAGILDTPRYLVFGAHRIRTGFARLLSRSEEADPAGKEEDDDSPKPTADVAKAKAVGDEEKENEKQAQ